MVFVCMVKECINSSKLTMKQCHMFRVPKDELLLKDWLANCNRKDLLVKSVDVLNKYYRVCSNHFKNNMFANPERTNLLPSAIPTEFSSDWEEVSCGASSEDSSTPSKQKQLTSNTCVPSPSSSYSAGSSSMSSSAKTAKVLSLHTPRKKKSNKWSILVGRDLLDAKIKSQRVFNKSSFTSPAVGANVRFISGVMPVKVFQKDECNKVPPDKSSAFIGKHSTPVINKDSSDCTCISSTSTPSQSPNSAQISQFLSADTPSVHGCKSKDSDNDNKIKFFKFSKDEPCSLMWVKAVNREKVSNNNSMNCNVQLSNGVHKKRLNLIKLSRRAVPNVSNPANVGQNVKPKIIVMNSNLNSSQKSDRKCNILLDHTYVSTGSTKLQKMSTQSDSKSSQKHVKKSYDKLSDHSYVLKLPVSSTSDETSSGKCTVQNLKVNNKVVDGPCIIDLTEPEKPPERSTSKRIENSNLVQIDKNSFENSEIDWRDIVAAQSTIIKDLRKKVKVLQQKIRRHNSRIEALRMKAT